MEEPADIRELHARATAGDVDAMYQWMQLQRSGRGLRLYPDGRRDPEDDGVIAFAVSVHGEGEARRWRIQSGKAVRAIEVPAQKAAELADAVLKKLGPTMVRHYPVDALMVGDAVWLRMPETAACWEMTDGEVASLAGTILAVLELSAS